MKIPEPKKLPSGNFFIQLRLGGYSHSITAPTSKDCKRQAELYKAEWRSGKRQNAPGGNLTLRECMERYIAKKERQRRSPSTIRGYDILLRCHFQKYQNQKVGSIKDWQAIYDAEAAPGPDGRPPAPKTLKNAWLFLCSCVRQEAGIHIPAVEQIALRPREHPFLQPDQIPKFMEAIKGNPQEIAMLLALSSLRCSEILGLEWECIDLEKKEVRIIRTAVRDKSGVLVVKDTTKTAGSRRTVPIFIPQLLTALESADEKEGRVCGCTEVVFRKSVNRVCAELGFPAVGPHGLRHSFASLCYSLGVPAKVTMALGGWSDYQTMMKIYTHLASKDLHDRTSELADFFAQNKNANGNANGKREAIPLQDI